MKFSSSIGALARRPNEIGEKTQACVDWVPPALKQKFKDCSGLGGLADLYEVQKSKLNHEDKAALLHAMKAMAEITGASKAEGWSNYLNENKIDSFAKPISVSNKPLARPFDNIRFSAPLQLLEGMRREELERTQLEDWEGSADRLNEALQHIPIQMKIRFWKCDSLKSLADLYEQNHANLTVKQACAALDAMRAAAEATRTSNAPDWENYLLHQHRQIPIRNSGGLFR